MKTLIIIPVYNEELTIGSDNILSKTWEIHSKGDSFKLLLSGANEGAERWLKFQLLSQH